MKKTLLLTDIVSSTALTQQIGDERMSKIWIKHDDIARSLLKQYKAVEADRTDGFLMLFDSVDEACQYAIQLHMGFEELSEIENIDFKTRIGIHTGDVILIETSEEHRAAGVKHIEVEGIAKPTAARVMSIANGGQTLLTTEALEELDKDSVKYTSHGHWRLKGVAEPVELFETGSETTLFHPPKDSDKVYRVNLVDDIWQPVKEIKHNLGTERDRFIGRKEDLHRLAELVNAPDTKLLTILGPGGTGKTRISKRFGRMWLGDFPGGVWFCDLSDSKSLEGITTAIASALGVKLAGDGAVTQLGNAIMGRGPCLIVLDNFEQITDFAEATLGKWLERAPKAKFMVTSRNLLELPGEKTMELKPLVVNKDGLYLFEARAAERKSSFIITEENRDDVVAIVNTLDGLPLAIELAAARIAVLKPKQIKERLKDRFKLLKSSKGVAGRQQTLSGAIDWSWDLLEEWERSALAQCSIFEGGFTLEAAEEVIDLSLFPDAPMVMDVVQSLVNKSLLRSDINRIEIEAFCFGMYVSIGEYSSLKLEDENAFTGAGKALKRNIQKRHAACFAQYGTDESFEELLLLSNAEVLKGLFYELDNVWTALQFSLNQKDDKNASCLIAAVWHITTRKGPLKLVREPSLQLLKMESASDHSKAKIYFVLSNYASNDSDTDLIMQSFDKGIEICKRSNLTDFHQYILMNCCYYYINQRKFNKADEMIKECFKLSDNKPGGYLKAWALYINGGNKLFQYKLDLAEQSFLECLDISNDRGFWELNISLQNTFATVKRLKCKWNDALVLFHKAKENAEEQGSFTLMLPVLGNLGYLYIDIGEYTNAQEHLNRSIKIARDTGSRREEAHHLLILARALILDHKFEEARKKISLSRDVCLEMKDITGESNVLFEFGFLNRFVKKYEAAFKQYQKGLEIGLRTGADSIIADAYWGLAITSSELGDQDQAEKYFLLNEKISSKNFIESLQFHVDRARTALYAGNKAAAKEKFDLAKDLKNKYEIPPNSYVQQCYDEVELLMKD